VNFLRLLFDEHYRERMNYACLIRAERRKRDDARAAGKDTDARYYQFSAHVTRNSRWVTTTRV
jgi:hypothetical protein